MGVVVGHLASSLRKAHGQAARGVGVAEHHVGDRVAGLHAEEPGHENGARAAHRTPERHRAAIAQQNDHRFARGGHGFGQVLLGLRQADVAARARLARHLLALADGQHHHVGVARGGHGGLDAAGQRRFDVRTARDGQPRGLGAQRGVQSFVDAHGRGLAREQAPGAHQVLRAFGEGADQRDLLRAGFRERQQLAFVLQHHDGAARALAGQRDELGVLHALRGRRAVEAAHRVVEEAELELDPQHAPHGLVEPRHRHLARGHEVGQVADVQAALHAHVGAGHEGQLGGLAAVGGVAVLDELFVGRVVGHHEALELPLVAQHAGEQRGVGGRGHAADLVEGAHDRQRARIDRRTERRQVDLAQRALGDFARVVVEPALGRAVGREVLGRGQHRVGVREVAALEAAHARRRELARQVRVFAHAFEAAAPARVARDVDHGREGPAKAVGRGLDRRRARRALGQRGLPARGLGQRHREDGAKAVDHVGAEDQRNAQPRLAHRHLLQPPLAFEAGVVEQAREAPVAHVLRLLLPVAPAGLRVVRDVDVGRAVEAELAGLFLQRHARDQRFDAGFGGVGGLEVFRNGRRDGGEGEGGQDEGENGGFSNMHGRLFCRQPPPAPASGFPPWA
ncbi:hypothetical protein D3C71_1119450 [compost metagenome]